MPVVNLTLPRSMPRNQQISVSEGVHSALVETFAVPANGKFQTITLYDADSLVMDREFLGVERGETFVYIQISVMKERSSDEKRALMRSLRSQLSTKAGLRNEDLFVNVVETDQANWFCMAK